MKKRAIITLLLALMFVTTNYYAATKYYLSQETSFYKDIESLASFGTIRKGEDIYITEINKEDDFVKISYAGEDGYIAKKNLTTEEVYVLSEKREGATVYETTWKDPEYLLPVSHYIEQINENSSEMILAYAATSDMEDDYLYIANHESIILSEKAINEAHQNGCECFMFTILNSETNKAHVSVVLKTYATDSTGTINLGFKTSGQTLTLQAQVDTEHVMFAVHNNYNVRASQNGKALASTTEGYTTFFSLEDSSEITFTGVVLSEEPSETTTAEIPGLADKGELSTPWYLYVLLIITVLGACSFILYKNKPFLLSKLNTRKGKK